MTDISRRDLLKGAAVAGAGLAASGAFLPAIAEDISAFAHPDIAPPAPAARATMKGVPFERREVGPDGVVGEAQLPGQLLHRAGAPAEQADDLAPRRLQKPLGHACRHVIPLVLTT